MLAYACCGWFYLTFVTASSQSLVFLQEHPAFVNRWWGEGEDGQKSIFADSPEIGKVTEEKGLNRGSIFISDS